MAAKLEVRHDIERYRPLGLVANPFVAPRMRGATVGTALEIRAASNRLMAAIAESASCDKAKPIVVKKSTDIPSAYALRAIGDVQASIGGDESLNVVHAYVQLYMMRKGRVRSTLGAVGERVAFRSFESTLASHIALLLDEPDDQLASYQVLGPEGLAAFADYFSQDPIGVTIEYFGEPGIERRPELARVADIRVASLDIDTDETETSQEVDATIGDAPGTGVGLAAEQDEEEEKRQAVVDYVIEHTSTHMSKVVARGLRMYRERGLAAMSDEWKVTKAPRKTLSAVADLAVGRFDKLAIIYDGFDSWMQIAEEMRHTIVVALSEMRWMLDTSAVFVLLLEDGGVPELEEQFGAGSSISWDFPHLVQLQDEPDALDAGIVDSWLEAARVSASPLSIADAALDSLAVEANGSLEAFVTMAAAAIEDAAERGVEKLDDTAVLAGIQARDDGSGDQ